MLRASISGQHASPDGMQAFRFGLAAELSFFGGSEVGNVAKHSTLQARWHVGSFRHQIISINTRGIHCAMAFIQLLLLSSQTASVRSHDWGTIQSPSNLHFRPFCWPSMDAGILPPGAFLRNWKAQRLHQA